MLTVKLPCLLLASQSTNHHCINSTPSWSEEVLRGKTAAFLHRGRKLFFWCVWVHEKLVWLCFHPTGVKKTFFWPNSTAPGFFFRQWSEWNSAGYEDRCQVCFRDFKLVHGMSFRLQVRSWGGNCGNNVCSKKLRPNIHKKNSQPQNQSMEVLFWRLF